MPANCLYSVTVALLTSSSAGRGDGASGRGDGARGRGARAAGHDHLLRLRRVDRVAIRADAVGLDVVVVGGARVARAQELARGHGDADAGRDAAARDREGAGAGDHQSEEHGGAHRGEFGPAQVVLPVVGRRCSVIRTDRAPPRRWSRAAADEEALRYESSSRNSSSWDRGFRTPPDVDAARLEETFFLDPCDALRPRAVGAAARDYRGWWHFPAVRARAICRATVYMAA